MNFCSDNVAGVAPEILDHLRRVNDGAAMPYGGDPVTERVEARLAEIFERAPATVASFPVATGTAANALCLAAVTPSYGAVYCHRDSHINVDECGAPELFTGGAKLVPLDGAGGKLDADTLEAALAAGGRGVVHHVQPACLSITQSTEAGTVYSPGEIAALSAVAHAHGLRVHMDGARFANALVALGCTPAEMTWKAGVDAVSFGATKNGALAAEAAVLFDPEAAASLPYRRKRGGHLFSKMRYLSAQLEAYLADDLWLRNARHANAMAARLAEGLSACAGVSLAAPLEANELFVSLPPHAAEAMRAAGYAFHPWPSLGPDCYRFVTAWDTDPADVAGLVEAAAGAVAA